MEGAVVHQEGTTQVVKGRFFGTNSSDDVVLFHAAKQLAQLARVLARDGGEADLPADYVSTAVVCVPSEGAPITPTLVRGAVEGGGVRTMLCGLRLFVA